MKLLYYILLFITFTINAQNKSGISTTQIDDINILVKEYDNFFLDNKSFVTSINPNNRKEKGLWKIFLNEDLSSISDTEKDPSFTETYIPTSDIGLKWVSDAMHNFRPGISDSEDLFFRSRFSTGLDWVILGEGSWLKRRREKSLFKRHITKDSLSSQMQIKEIHIQGKLDVIQNVFDLHRLDVLRKYAELLEQQAVYYQKMHEKDLVTYTTKLKADQQVKEITEIIALNESYLQKKIDDNLIKKYWFLPYDFEDLPKWTSITEEKLLVNEELLSDIRKEILLHSTRESDKPNLRAKFRYNYYDTENHTGRSFASIGASLTVPIRFSKRDVLMEYELASYDEKIKYEKTLLKNRLIKQHRQYYTFKNELYKIENELEYIHALLKNELEIYTKMNKNFSPANYIKQVENYVQKKIEQLDLQQKICEEFIIFYNLSGLDSALPMHNENISPNNNSYKKSTYLWKKDFDKYSTEDIIAILLSQNIEVLLLSPGNEELKTQSFLLSTSSTGIEVNRLIGENSFALTDSGWEKLLKKLEDIKNEGFTGIHLDIEPHTFNDYKINKDTYTQRMNTIYEKANEWCKKNNMRISVSIPMNLPEENAKLLAKNEMTAYIMAYENTNQEKLLSRTISLREILGTHFVWVLRLSDFSSSEILTQAEQTLKTANIENIGYYDFSKLTH